LNKFSKTEKIVISLVLIAEVVWIGFLGLMVKTHGMEIAIKYNIFNTQKKPLPDGSIINHEGFNYRVYYLKE